MFNFDIWLLLANWGKNDSFDRFRDPLQACNCSCRVLPASYVATQYDAKALKQSREKLVDGHVGHRSRGIMGYVLPVDQHVVAGGLHGDDGMGAGGIRVVR